VLTIPLAAGLAMTAASAIGTAAVMKTIQKLQEQQTLSEREKLARMAERDCLTGLFNRASARRRIEEYLNRATAEQAALLVIDLDNFKDINDHCGHLIGDEALCGMGELLQRVFRSSDVVSRVGGDEFIVFMPSISSARDVMGKAEIILDSLAQKKSSRDLDENSCTTCSIGIALFPQHGKDYEELFSVADAAMYQAKESGKNSYLMCHSIA
jgi:diguanylate cyclase (GGDEF)-like protein